MGLEKRFGKLLIFIFFGLSALATGHSNAFAAELGEQCWEVRDATTQGLLASVQVQVTSHGSVYSLAGMEHVTFLAVHGSAVRTPDGFITMGLEVVEGSPAGDATIKAKLDPVTLSGSGSLFYYGQSIQKLVNMVRVVCTSPL